MAVRRFYGCGERSLWCAERNVKGQASDAVLLVRYPSREVFLQMVRYPGYQEVTALRTSVLTEAVLQATVPEFIR